MRPDAIVVLPPPAGDATDFLEAAEDFTVEQFVVRASIEALDMGSI